MPQDLHDGWTVRAVGGPVPQDVAGRAVPATVPGCVHLDLMAAGLIPDPYLDQNEDAVQWVGRVDWCYETTFSWAPGPDGGQVDLVALGLDTVATVELNGQLVSRTANQHRSYRFEVGSMLAAGQNRLSVTFAAGLTAAERASAELGPLPHVNTHPYNAIRKMASNYGWDWGPDLVTAGIWRPLRLEEVSGARIAAVRPLVDVQEGTGLLSVHVDVERRAGAEQDLVVRAGVGQTWQQVELPAGTGSATLTLSVPQVQLWWPHGYGGQPLYPVQVTLERGGPQPGSPLDSWRGRVGFRTVSLDTGQDEHGTRFTLSVNGVPVFARGANWIPDDAFPARITRQRYAERVEQAVQANINLLRVWGGGLYESEDFYDVCDEAGVLVWQDFLFACAAYTEAEPLRSEVLAEAREAVTRLSPHPSLVLWNGGNENLWGYEDWGWRESIGDRSWGLGYYHELLPAIVAELDPSRPYCPGTPWSPQEGVHPNDPSCGTKHEWEVWNRIDYTRYRDYVPRFVSEFGFQSPPAWTTLTRVVHDEPLSPFGPAMLVHQKAEEGNDKLARGLVSHLPEPRSIEDWHWATSLNAARAVGYGIEHLRSWSPVCMGALVWQLNDCWPVVSWAAVDGDGRRKPLWYAIRHSFREQLLTIQPREGAPTLVAVNDSGLRWSGTVSLRRMRLDGTVLATGTLELDVDPRSTTGHRLAEDLVTPADPSAELVVADGPGTRATWFFTEDVDTGWRPADLEVDVERVEGGYLVTASATTVVRDLALLADKVAADAQVDQMLITLLPGESARFRVSTSADVDPKAFLDPQVLRSTNQLVAGG